MVKTVDLLDSANQKFDPGASGMTSTNAEDGIIEAYENAVGGGGNVSTPDAAAEGSTNITHVVGLTQAEYDGSVQDANTLYVVVG